MPEAERLRAGEVDAIVRVPPDFSRRLAAGGARATGAERQQLHHRADAGRLCRRRHRPLVPAPGRARGRQAGAGVEVVQRMWFNEAGISTWYLVPGLLVLVLTLIGAFLTSLLIAREWERGTLESLFVTPVRPGELVLAAGAVPGHRRH